MLDLIQDLMNGLLNQDEKIAYQCLKQLLVESSTSSQVYPYINLFVEMLEHSNSYIWTRGILLIAANAKWDDGNRIDEIIHRYNRHIMDDKPITARQCIKVLPSLVQYKPELKDCIVQALHHADPLRYQLSMQSLVAKDIQKALADIGKLSKK